MPTETEIRIIELTPKEVEDILRKHLNVPTLNGVSFTVGYDIREIGADHQGPGVQTVMKITARVESKAKLD